MRFLGFFLVLYACFFLLLADRNSDTRCIFAEFQYKLLRGERSTAHFDPHYDKVNFV